MTKLQPSDFTIRVVAQAGPDSAISGQLALQHQTAQAVYSAQEATAQAMKEAVYRALASAGIDPDPFAAVRGPYVDHRG